MSAVGRLPSRNRWLAVALVVSLAINAFFAGAIATDFLRVKSPSGSPEARALRFELRWLEGRLSADAIKQVEAAVVSARPNAVAHLDRLRALRTELGGLAAVPEPDRVAIDAKLAEIRAEVQSMQTEAQAVTIDALLALPAGTRATLAQPPTRP